VNLNKTSLGFSAGNSSSNLMAKHWRPSAKIELFNGRSDKSQNFRNIINELTFINYSSSPSKLRESKQMTQKLLAPKPIASQLNLSKNSIKILETPGRPSLGPYNDASFRPIGRIFDQNSPKKENFQGENMVICFFG
jgi:hypothetical protein